jgi:hypothetical protein
MEFMMNKKPRIPDPETSKRLLANLRRARLELDEANLQLGFYRTSYAKLLQIIGLNP